MKKSIGKARIGGKGRNLQNPVIPIALSEAVQLTQQLRRQIKLDEEVITDSFLGMIFASMAWASAIAGVPSRPTQSFCWGRYRKYLDKRIWNRESHVGADFALLVSDNPIYVRIALFQSKLPEIKKIGGRRRHAINVHHRAKKEGKLVGTTQMVSLSRFAAKLSAIAPPKERLKDKDWQAAAALNAAAAYPNIVTFDWVHYLAYTRRFMAAPLCAFQRQYATECSDTNRDNYSHLPKGTRTFLKLIRNCFTDQPEGWITVEIHKVSQILPALIDLMPIQFADSDGALALALKNLKLTEDIQIVVEEPRADLSKIAHDLASSGATRTPDLAT